MKTGEDRTRETDTSRWVSDALASWNTWAEMLGAWGAMLGGGAASKAADMGAFGGDRGWASSLTQSRATLNFMGQAYLVLAKSGLRYWARAAQTYGQHLPALTRLLTATSPGKPNDPEEQRILLDEVRALLRGLAELPGEESRRMEAELAELEERMLTEIGGRDDDYTRRHSYIP